MEKRKTNDEQKLEVLLDVKPLPDVYSFISHYPLEKSTIYPLIHYISTIYISTILRFGDGLKTEFERFWYTTNRSNLSKNGDEAQLDGVSYYMNSKNVGYSNVINHPFLRVYTCLYHPEKW